VHIITNSKMCLKFLGQLANRVLSPTRLQLTRTQSYHTLHKEVTIHDNETGQ